MLRYLAKRFLMILPTIFVPLLLVFLLLRLSPGDPAGMMLGDQATPEQIAALRAELGLDQPIWTQFIIWLKDILTLNLGDSIFFRKPVMEVIPPYAAVTIQLAAVGLVLAIVFGVTLGTISAMKRNRPVDRAVVTSAVLGISLPEFWFALLLIFVFAVTLRWFPVAGYNPPSAGLIAFASTIFLPALALGIRQSALMTRMMRSSMLDVLNEPYITTARAQGLPESKVIGQYAMRTASIPVVTVAGLSAGYMLGGAVAIEIIFALPGLGRMLVEAVGRRDYPLVEGGVLTISLVLAVLNLAIDIVYAWLDPRIRYQ
ncbi:ABC transporter permease [Martelella mediterranea]|uniref:Glutathione transport system permease protein GsiC n=1 Tax=Martelella mediterranea DSM 17316 TaxID=1122214 RepID=A0A1U9YWK5_9HYPH|nr:ABC transporter permease [Martelella mediterranea]AQZ49831.1 Glutathione transport system permease protein GsiC [Martelella mediterranea DSM 17316]MCD1636971.1 ABC transporter permease [Martelella mediterranea]